MRRFPFIESKFVGALIIHKNEWKNEEITVKTISCHFPVRSGYLQKISDWTKLLPVWTGFLSILIRWHIHTHTYTLHPLVHLICIYDIKTSSIFYLYFVYIHIALTLFGCQSIEAIFFHILLFLLFIVRWNTRSNWILQSSVTRAFDWTWVCDD